MANNVSYNQLWSDSPELHLADGYVSIGVTGAPSFVLQRSPIVAAVNRTGVGAYDIVLAENWPALLYVDIKSVIPAGLSPAVLGHQILSWTVGIAASSQKVSVFFHSSGTPTELPNGSGFCYQLALKNLSSGV